MDKRLAVSGAYLGYFALITLACLVAGKAFVAQNIVAETWQQGFGYKAALSGFVALLCPLTIRDYRLPSAFVQHLILLLIVNPTLTLYTLGIGNLAFVVLTVSAYAVLSTLSRAKLNLVRMDVVSSKALLWGALIVVSGYFLSLIYFGQLEFFNSDIMNVYDLRRDAAANLPDIFRYISPIVSKAAIPAGLAVSLYRKNWASFLVFSLFSLGSFAFTSHKEPILFPAIALFTYIFSARTKMLLVFVAIALVGAAFLAFDALQLSATTNGATAAYPGGGLAADYLLRRGLMIPSLLNWYYFEFFRDVQYWWSTSRITLGLIAPPFDQTPPMKIGLEYFGSDRVSANAGWIGSGLANAYIFGALLYSAAFGLLLSAMDSFATKRHGAFVTTIFVVPLITLIMSGDLFTTLLTHGLLFSVVLAFVVEAPPPAIDSASLRLDNGRAE